MQAQTRDRHGFVHHKPRQGTRFYCAHGKMSDVTHRFADFAF